MSTLRPDVLSRAQACLLGQLAGDSLGSHRRVQGSARITRLYPAGVRLLQDGGTWNTIAGQPTDDSEMALALARSLTQPASTPTSSTLPPSQAPSLAQRGDAPPSPRNGSKPSSPAAPN